ncbi:PREDICTED: uncharacterized protein LOC109359862 [Lupinus angustifolius]|uniref:uncharacterized protein LOC109359862 n=1 Tax=Lupinus angustifolius TaxID=3871 RepID=UPI00092FB0FB|nr:PREDICTED: uncharacterized protein LOC109359862 [Lupinus angustifolius]
MAYISVREIYFTSAKIHFDPSMKLQLEQDTIFSDVLCYKRLVGRLLYLNISRSDIAYVVQQLSFFMCKPIDVYYRAALKVLHYLKSLLLRASFSNPHLRSSMLVLLTQIGPAIWSLGSPLQASAYSSCDNRSVIYLAHNLVFHERLNHIEVDCHVVREKIHKGLIHLLPISSRKQLANAFTKPLPQASFHSSVSKLGLCSLHHPT